MACQRKLLLAFAHTKNEKYTTQRNAEKPQKEENTTKKQDTEEEQCKSPKISELMMISVRKYFKDPSNGKGMLVYIIVDVTNSFPTHNCKYYLHNSTSDSLLSTCSKPTSNFNASLNS
jgi:hypothetical protein